MHVLDQIFHKTFRVMVSHGALLEIEEKEIEIEADPMVDGFVADDGSSVSSFSPCEEHLLATIRGRPILVGDYAEQQQTLERALPTDLTVNEIVELYDVMRDLVLLDSADVLPLFEILNEYLILIAERSGKISSMKYSPNYVPPPDEDIRKMTVLRDAVVTHAHNVKAEQSIGKRKPGLFNRARKTTISSKKTLRIGGIEPNEINAEDFMKNVYGRYS